MNDISVYLVDDVDRGEGGVPDQKNELEAFPCGFCPESWSFERLLSEKRTAPGSKGRMSVRNVFFWSGTPPSLICLPR